MQSVARYRTIPLHAFVGDLHHSAEAIATTVVGLLDALPIALGLTDREGQFRYVNPALRRLLDTVSHDERLVAALIDVARRVPALGAPQTTVGLSGDSVNHPRLATSALDRWRLTAVLLPPCTAAALGAPVVICVDGGRPTLERIRALRTHYALTKREMEVAILLGEGCSTERLASALSISWHTARRHTESILRKLGVHCRSEVAARLLDAPTDDAACRRRRTARHRRRVPPALEETVALNAFREPLPS